MRKLTFIAFLCTLLLISCNQEEYSEASSTSNQSGIVFKLQKKDTKEKKPAVRKMSPHLTINYTISL